MGKTNVALGGIMNMHVYISNSLLSELLKVNTAFIWLDTIVKKHMFLRSTLYSLVHWFRYV